MIAWPLIFILLGQACFAVNIGEACTDASSCTGITNVKCSGGKCECADGFKGATGTQSCTAVPDGKVNAACAGSKPCAAANSGCVSNFCACNSGFTGEKGDDKCVPDTGKIGGSCKAAQPHCDDTANAKCDSNICKCNDGYQAAPGEATCAAVPDGKVNAACAGSKPCAAANSGCVSNFCACNSGFTGEKGDDKCVLKNKGNNPGSLPFWLLSLIFIVVSKWDCVV